MEALESWLKALKLELEAFLGANQAWPRESRALSVSQKVSRSWARGQTEEYRIEGEAMKLSANRLKFSELE